MRRGLGRIGVLLVVAATGAARPSAGQQGWRGSSCDLKPGHSLVSDAVSALRDAVETTFADQREKKLGEARRALEQALTSAGQDKNPAAWYYLGRYYVEMKDEVGADSAFSRAVALAPTCVADVNGYRRQLWVPIINAGLAAWRGGNKDSAIVALRRADGIYAGEPLGFTYLATLFANANQTDSAAKYFKLAVPAAHDPKYAKDKKDALFNVARVYHAAHRYDDAAAAYRDYLALYPDDVEGQAGLAEMYSLSGKQDQAKALYAGILARADSMEAGELFAVGRAVLRGISNAPDTMAQGKQCRAAARRTSRTLTIRQVALRCDSVTTTAMRAYETGTAGDYALVLRAFEVGLSKDPFDRGALFTYTGAATLAGDTARAVAGARQLYAVDPLNGGTLRMVAQAWYLKGVNDSTVRYLRLADSLVVEVTVHTFTPGDHDASLAGTVANPRSKPSPALTLTFEFVNVKGEVVATQQQDVAVIAPGASVPFELKPQGAGIMAWRYRR